MKRTPEVYVKIIIILTIVYSIISLDYIQTPVIKPFETQSFEAQIAKTYGEVKIDSIVSVYDGDTFTVNINNWPAIVGSKISIRVNRIDTPEMTSQNASVRKLAVISKNYLKSLLKAQNIKLINIGRDKYFRIDADVIANNVDVAQMMIKEGLAKPYDGGTKVGWTESDYINYMRSHR